MAIRKPFKLFSAVLATSVGTALFTSPVNTKTTISAMTATNTAATAAKLTVYLVPSAGTAGVSNAVCYNRVLAPNETFIVSGALGEHLEAGDFINAISDTASAITLVSSGYQET